MYLLVYAQVKLYNMYVYVLCVSICVCVCALLINIIVSSGCVMCCRFTESGTAGERLGSD